MKIAFLLLLLPMASYAQMLNQLPPLPGASDLKDAQLSCTPTSATTPVYAQAKKKWVFKYTSPDQITPELAKRIHASPDDLLSITPDTPWYISITDQNDNAIYAPNKTGNDYALTGTTSVEVGKVTKSGITIGVFGYTALFSDRIYQYKDKTTGAITNVPFIGYKATKGPPNSTRVKSGDIEQQQFNESNIMGLFINSRAQAKVLFFDGALGFTSEESNRVSKIGESGLQQADHQAFNLQKLQSLPDNQDDEYGVYFKAMLGLQADVFDNKSCSLKVWGEVGGSGDSSGRNNTYALQNGEIDFTIKKRPGGMPASVMFKAGGNAQEGPISMAALTAGLSISVSRFTLENDASFLVAGKGFTNAFTPNGATRVDKDNIYTLKLIVKIGKMRH